MQLYIIHLPSHTAPRSQCQNILNNHVDIYAHIVGNLITEHASVSINYTKPFKDSKQMYMTTFLSCFKVKLQIIRLHSKAIYLHILV